MTGALDVVGQVMIAFGDDAMTVDAQGDRVVVGLPSLRGALRLLRRRGRRGDLRPMLEQIHAALNRADLALHVRVGRSIVARLGVGSRPGVVSRLFRVGPLEVRPAGIRLGPGGR